MVLMLQLEEREWLQVVLGRSRLDISKQFSNRLVGHWHRLPTEMVESSSLEVFRNSGDVAPRDVV